MFQQYELVRVVRLIQPLEAYDGWKVNQRPPSVGDIGTLLDRLSADGSPDMYVVECSGSDGVTIWLADFYPEEIEALTRG